MNTFRKKPLLLGENEKSGIIKGTPIIGGDCMYCDLPVWASDIAYTTDSPGVDQDIKNVAVKPLHKLCLLELVAVGMQVAKAMGINLKTRGEL